MANEVSCTTADVRPLRGAIIRRAVAAEALSFGQVVYVSSYSGDLPAVSKATGAAVATGNPFGIVIAPSTALAGTSVASGEACDVVVFGPVTGYSGMTSGNTIWVSSDTAGANSKVVGTHSGVVGLAETPATIFVRPGLFIVST